MRFYHLAVFGLARRPARSFLTVMGIGVAFAGFVALVGLSGGMERAFVDLFLGRGTHVVAVRRQTIEILSAVVDEQRTAALSRVEGVSEVSGELVDLVGVGTGDSALVSGWPEASYLWKTLTLRKGRLPAPGSLDEVLIGPSIAEALGKGLGDEVDIGTRTFRITGEFAASDITSTKLIILPLGALQQILGREGRVTLFNIRLKRPANPKEVAAVTARLTAVFPDLEFLPTRDVARNNRPLRLLRAVAWGASTVALILAVVLVLNTMLMSVTERKREIGALLAVGWQTSRIMALVTLEGSLLALGGGVVGTSLGFGALRWLAGVAPLHGFLKPAMTSPIVGLLIAATIALGALGSVVPAYRAARVDAIRALRSR